jgi:hypothetical protein
VQPAAIAQPETIPLRYSLSDTGPLAWLELASDDPDNLPSRVRAFERDGNVICVSDPAVHGISRDGEPRSASLRMPLPPHLAAAVRSGALDAYRFEALIAHRWVGVRLMGNPAMYRDKRGRVFRRA